VGLDAARSPISSQASAPAAPSRRGPDSRSFLTASRGSSAHRRLDPRSGLLGRHLRPAWARCGETSVRARIRRPCRTRSSRFPTDAFRDDSETGAEEPLCCRGRAGWPCCRRQVAEQAGPDALVIVCLPDGGSGITQGLHDAWRSSYGSSRSTRLDTVLSMSYGLRRFRCESGSAARRGAHASVETVRDALRHPAEYALPTGLSAPARRGWPAK